MQYFFFVFFCGRGVYGEVDMNKCKNVFHLPPSSRRQRNVPTSTSIVHQGFLTGGHGMYFFHSICIWFNLLSLLNWTLGIDYVKFCCCIIEIKAWNHAKFSYRVSLWFRAPNHNPSLFLLRFWKWYNQISHYQKLSNKQPDTNQLILSDIPSSNMKLTTTNFRTHHVLAMKWKSITPSY